MARRKGTHPLFTVQWSFRFICLGLVPINLLEKLSFLFGRVFVTYNNIDDGHNENIRSLLHVSISLAGDQFCGRYKGCMLLGASREKIKPRLSSLSMATERKLGIQLDIWRDGCAKFVANAISNNSTDNVLSTTYIRFGLVLEFWILRHVQGFRVGWRI